jgi:FAD binding domain
LEGEHEADAVVVGAGIAGLTAALALREAKKSVIVLEARRVGRLVGLDGVFHLLGGSRRHRASVEALLREQPSDPLLQLGRTVWFWHQGSFVAQRLRGIGGLRDARGKNGLDGRSLPSDPLSERKTIDRARHLHIREDDIDRQCCSLQDIDGFIAAAGFNDPVAAVAQMFGDHPTNEDLVLHHQHGSWEIRIAGVYRFATHYALLTTSRLNAADNIPGQGRYGTSENRSSPKKRPGNPAIPCVAIQSHQNIGSSPSRR